MSGNAFEEGRRKAIPAVLVYARNRGRVLMIHRVSETGEGRPGDYHAGKWNGLGGKCDLDESPIEAARREFHEEAGVAANPEGFRPLGALTFPNFKAHKNEDWLVYVFTLELDDENAALVGARNPEGDLHWVPEDRLAELNLWPGDRYFIPHVVSGRPFMGTIWYDGPRVARHWVQGI